MNKFKLAENLYRQNVYNVLGENGYQHYTCYFTGEKELIAVFKAGDNYGLQTFVESEETAPLILGKKMLALIKSVLNSWTYDHLEPIDLYNPTSIWMTSETLKGLYELNMRDYYVLGLVVD